MKSKPYGPLNINTKNAKQLRLENLYTIQLQFISIVVIVKLVTSIEAALTCLKISIVQRNTTLIYIDSKSPNLQTKNITKNWTLFIYSIVTYIHKSSSIKDVPFKTYYKKYELSKHKLKRNTKTCLGIDNIENYLYEYRKSCEIHKLQSNYKHKGFLL